MAQQVFISSPFLEFQKERMELHRVLTKVLPVACEVAEYLTSQTKNLEHELEKCIKRSNIIILLIGSRYGGEDRGKSWTQKEIEFAKKHKKEILPYMKVIDNENISKIRNNYDIDKRKSKQLKKFVKYIEKGHPNIPRFRDLFILTGLVVRDVTRLVGYCQSEETEADYVGGFE